MDTGVKPVWAGLEKPLFPQSMQVRFLMGIINSLRQT
jgi:hypothetical protein